MPLTETPVGNQIGFKEELIRKGTHMGALIIPASYYWFGLSKGEMLAIMVPAFLLMLLIDISRLNNWWFWQKIARPVMGKLMREHEEKGEFTGATYILLSVCCTVALYSKPIAVAALAFIIVGDSFAAIIGRRIGKHKIGQKSVEGSLACFAGTVLVACFAPGLPLATGLIGAVVATVVEALPLKIDDNITVPLASGLIMTLVQKFLMIT